MLRPQLFKNIFIINLKRQAIIGYNMWKLEFVWKHKSLFRTPPPPQKKKQLRLDCFYSNLD